MVKIDLKKMCYRKFIIFYTFRIFTHFRITFSFFRSDIYFSLATDNLKKLKTKNYFLKKLYHRPGHEQRAGQAANGFVIRVASCSCADVVRNERFIGGLVSCGVGVT